MGLFSGVAYGSIYGFRKGTKISKGEIKSSLITETTKVQTISISKLRLFNMFHHGFRYGFDLFLFQKYIKNEIISQSLSGGLVGSLFGILASIGRKDYTRVYYLSYGGGIGTFIGGTYSILSKPIKDQINELSKDNVSIEEIQEFKKGFDDMQRF
eukprot:gene9825-2147_t